MEHKLSICSKVVSICLFKLSVLSICTPSSCIELTGFNWVLPIDMFSHPAC